MTEKFLVIHGMISEVNANDINTILKDYKDYKIAEPSIIISNENYKIVQIKKNLEESSVLPFFLPPFLPPFLPRDRYYRDYKDYYWN